MVLRPLWGTLLALSVGVASAVAACDAPLGAIRRGPPSGIEARVVAARAPAPPIHLEGTAGAFDLADAAGKESVLLVFYRGHW
jgi:hypothetical protein